MKKNSKLAKKASKKLNRKTTKSKDVIVNHKGKLNRRTLLKISVFLVIIGLIGLGVGLYNRSYAEKIYPKIMIAGVKVGGMTRQEAKLAVEQKIQELNTQGPEITYNDQTLHPKLDEMGVTFDVEKIVNEAFAHGHQGTLTDKLFANSHLFTKGYVLNITPQIDEAKFDQYLSQLATVVEKSPVNASLAFDSGQVILHNSEKGRGLDKTKLKTDLTALVNSGQTNGKIALVTSDLEPAIDEEGTQSAKTQAEKYLASAPITATFENQSWSADRAEIGSWIKFSESGDKLVTSASPSGFVNWVAGQVEVAAVNREVQDGTNDVLAEGQDGRGVDTDTLTAQINEALKNGQGASFALVTYAVARETKTIYPHAQPDRYAGHYIDINLSEQTLYAFDGAKLMNQFLISSGKSGYATPTGEYSVWGKTALQKMSGPDYYLPNVPWISWFNGEISIHGTYWHDNFGTPMSHGCINASIPDAEWVYNFVEEGTPVYVHY